MPLIATNVCKKKILDSRVMLHCTILIRLIESKTADHTRGVTGPPLDIDNIYINVLIPS